MFFGVDFFPHKIVARDYVVMSFSSSFFLRCSILSALFGWADLVATIRGPIFWHGCVVVFGC